MLIKNSYYFYERISWNSGNKTSAKRQEGKNDANDNISKNIRNRKLSYIDADSETNKIF